MFKLIGFSLCSVRWVVGVWIVFVFVLVGWVLGGQLGVVMVVVVGVVLVFVQWWGQLVWLWVVLGLWGWCFVKWNDLIILVNN